MLARRQTLSCPNEAGKQRAVYQSEIPTFLQKHTTYFTECRKPLLS